MSILKDKSNENYITAKLLLDNRKYSPSVHCSYYSCIQLMKYIFIEINGNTEAELLKQQQTNEQNLHEFLINHFINLLKHNNIYRAYRESIAELPSLKMLRVKADYKALVITELEATKAYSLSEKIAKDLKFLNGIR